MLPTASQALLLPLDGTGRSSVARKIEGIPFTDTPFIGAQGSNIF